MIPISNMIILDEEDKGRLRSLANRVGVNTSLHKHQHFGKAFSLIDLNERATTITIDTWFVDMMETIVSKLEEVC